MRNNTCCSLQGSGQFWQRNITILRNQLFQKCAMGCELTMPFGGVLALQARFPLACESFEASEHQWLLKPSNATPLRGRSNLP